MTRHADRLGNRAQTVCAVVILAAATSLVAACGGTTIPIGTGSLPTLPGGLTSTPSGASGPTSGNLGDTLVMEDAGDDIAHVTMLKVFDPAVGTNDVSPPDGTRWVGFEGTIVINGSRSGQDSTEVEVIGSDGQTYGADTAYALSTFDGCTATPNDAAQLASGQTQTFCAGVGLPPGITVAKIGYSTEGVEQASIPAKLFWTVAASSAPAATDTPSPSPTDTPTPSPSDTPSASPSATATPATQ